MSAELKTWRAVQELNPITCTTDGLQQADKVLNTKLQTGFFDAAVQMEAVMCMNAIRYELGQREQEVAEFRSLLDDDKYLDRVITWWRKAFVSEASDH